MVTLMVIIAPIAFYRGGWCPAPLSSILCDGLCVCAFVPGRVLSESIIDEHSELNLASQWAIEEVVVTPSPQGQL